MANQLDELGRAKMDGQEWVAYSDGAYRHVVRAEDFDSYDGDSEESDADNSEPYTAWCQSSRFADDDIAIAVARIVGLDTVHSADGGCGLLSVAM